MLPEENRKYFNDFRPVLHYSVPSAWMNDPNGLICHEGYYHLYYQYYPGGMEHGPMHWGHARSRDLVRWEECGTALSPDEKGEIFSGSMVYDQNNSCGLGKKDKGPLVAVFTQHKTDGAGSVTQTQSLAVSEDGGNSFVKFKGNPVLCDSSRDFRDPKIIRCETEQKYIMALAKGRSICFYDSFDLIHWRCLSAFEEENREEEDVWECPDLLCFPLENGVQKWVLLFSVSTKGHEGDKVVYYTGTFDGVRFVPDRDSRRLILDFGSDHYAAVTFADTGERKLMIGWMNNWRYAHRIPAASFRGSMTFPRELRLELTDAGYRLYQQPAGELSRVLSRKNSLRGYKGPVALSGRPCMIRIKTDSPDMRIVIGNNRKHFEVRIGPDRRSVSLDRRQCDPGLGGEALDRRRGVVEREVEKITLLLDANSVEVFVNDGEAAGTMLCFWEEPFKEMLLSGEAQTVEVFESVL